MFKKNGGPFGTARYYPHFPLSFFSDGFGCPQFNAGAFQFLAQCLSVDLGIVIGVKNLRIDHFGGVYKPNLWGFHETVTDILRDSNLLTLPKKNRQLNGVLNAFIESRSVEPPSSLAEFFERRHLLSQH